MLGHPRHPVFQVTRMLEEHDWIHSERQFFGQPNTSYDFKTNNPREAGQRLKKLEETTTKLERNVNKRAMNMLNEAEERVRTLQTDPVAQILHRSFTWFSQTLVLPRLPAVQRPDEEEEDCGERQSKNLADHWGAGPEEEWSSECGLAEGQLLASQLTSSPHSTIFQYTEICGLNVLFSWTLFTLFFVSNAEYRKFMPVLS